jgi:sialic acid synthase SpsE
MISTNNLLEVIAEIGVNHDGSMKKAEELVLASKAAGANTVKLQVFSAATLASNSTPFAPYQEISKYHTSHKAMLAAYELTQDQICHLADFTQSVGLDFLATPYTVEDAKFLSGLGLKRVKTASADVTDLRLHQYLAETEIDVLMSTGMASDQEILKAISMYRNSSSNLILLHCVSLYPTKHELTNIRRIPYLRRITQLDIGYSDHSLDSVAAVIALALGARIFEKHITLNTKDPGPDHNSSLSPPSFSLYVRDLKAALDCLLKDGAAVINGEELQMKLTSRKSLHSATQIPKGHILKEDDLTLMRPGNGIPWEWAHLVLGKRTKRILPPGYQISLDDLLE